MYLVQITDIAEEDILGIVKYFTDVLKAPISAKQLLDEIEKCEKVLSKNPNMFSFVPDEYLKSKKIKYVMIKNYMMFYTINEGKKIVQVIRFLYGPRDWQNILRKKTGKG